MMSVWVYMTVLTQLPNYLPPAHIWSGLKIFGRATLIRIQLLMLVTRFMLIELEESYQSKVTYYLAEKEHTLGMLPRSPQKQVYASDNEWCSFVLIQRLFIPAIYVCK
jgi:hypothetical protein